MKRFILSLNQLRGAMPALSLAKAGESLPLVQASLDEFEINDREEVCAYLANLGHESLDLTRPRENMNYSAKRLREVFGKKYFPTAASAQAVAGNPVAIANIVYGGRMGNVNPGDGWRYRGGGPIGSTGRDMYRAAGRALNLPLEEKPELIEQLEVGLRVAAWTWAVDKKCGVVAKRLRGVADKQEVKLLAAICRLINGGLNGLEDRVARYARALKAIPVTACLPDVPVSLLPPGYQVQETGPTAPQPSELDVKSEPLLTPAPTAEADLHADFSKLVKNESIKQSAKTAGLGGLKFLWRPLLLLVTAIKTGNAWAISGTVLTVGLLIAAAVLYHKEIIGWAKRAVRYATEFFE